MKIVKIEGQLGLQMFQYALFLAVNAIYDDVRMTGKRFLPNEIFNISNGNRFCTQKIKFPWQADPYRELCAVKNPKNKEDLENLPESCILEVNEPSYLCFDHIAEIVKQEFNFTQSLPAPEPSQAETVAMHVKIPSGQKSTCCTSDYYNWAVANINTFVPGAKFTVITDNRKWVDRNISGLPEGSIITDSQNISHGLFMHTLASASHVIMSDSYADWWGAYLNSNPDKIVIAPQRWRCTNSVNNLLPLYWTIIPVT